VLREREGIISFTYPYMYYYFVARYFRDNMHEKEIQDYVKQMSEQLHHEEAANVMLFLGYLSKNPLVLDALLSAAEKQFATYSERDLGENSEYLQELVTEVPQFVLDSSSNANERRRELLAKKDRMRAEALFDEESSAHRSLEEPEDDLRDVLKINTAFKTIQILGQVVRNFHGSLRGMAKVELAEQCYSLGLRVLSFFFDSVEADRAEIIRFLVEFLRSRNPEWSEERLTREVRSFLFNLLEGVAFAVVKQVSDSIGLERLALTFDEVLEQNESVSHRFIDLSVRLDYYRYFPEREMFALYRDIRDNPFAAQLLRHLAWYHFYIYPVSYRLQQSVCARLGIRLLPAAHDRRVKQIRGPSGVQGDS
jgi:hypothetical protein